MSCPIHPLLCSQPVRLPFVFWGASIAAVTLTTGCCQHLPADTDNRPQLSRTLPVLELIINDRRIAVEVAADEPARRRGLMFRSSLAPDSGMLFVFESDEQRSFWMHNTYIPLSIAFINSAGVIINILEMTPLDTTVRYLSEGPARYALEMNSGWFTLNSIKSGDTVRGLTPLGLDPPETVGGK